MENCKHCKWFAVLRLLPTYTRFGRIVVSIVRDPEGGITYSSKVYITIHQIRQISAYNNYKANILLDGL